MKKRNKLFQRRRLLIAFLIVIGTLPFTVAAQETASVNGIVSDKETGETLLLANIALIEINKGTSSNNSGYYSITGIEPGNYTLVATYIGYRRFEKEISLEGGESLRLDIQLVPESIELEEVTVQSEAEAEEQKNIGTSQLTTQLIKDLPAVIIPDVFRSVQLLPGVKAASDFSSGLYIRGGSPDQTLILLDETTVYNPTHFFGFYSTFNPDAVKDVRLFKGGYPAQYGGRIGSVLTVYNKDGNRNRTGGAVSVGLLASRVFMEGPVKNGSWMLAIRRSTLEPFLAIARNSSDNIPNSFHFLDINGKFNVDPTPNDRFSLAFYAGNDKVSFPFRDDANIGLRYGNQTVSASWKKILSEKVFGSLTVTGSRYFNKPGFEIAGTPFERDNDILDISVKADFEFDLNSANTLSAGVWAGNLELNFNDSFDNNDTFNNRINTNYSSAYLQNKWQPADQWILAAGVRTNYFTEGNYLRLSPRASVEFRPAEKVRLQAAYGRYHQFLTLVTNEAFSGFDLWLTTDDGVPPSFGDQFVLGIKTIPFSGFALDAELYYRTMRDLFELDPFITDQAGLDYSELFRFGEGDAWGAEFLFEKQTGTVTGFLGYTYGETRRKFPGFNTDLLNPAAGARFFPPKFDRRHDFNVVGNLRLSDRWSANAVFNYATGQPFTEPSGRTSFSDVPFGTDDRNVFTVGNVNASRLPAYHRLDFGFIRSGTFFNMGRAEWHFQIINAYSRRNVWFFQFDFDENPVDRDEVTLLPIVPSVSYTVNF